MIVDYHMHLRDRPGGEARGRYGADRAEEYVEQARASGVDEIGFTDHVYHFSQSRGALGDRMDARALHRRPR